LHSVGNPLSNCQQMEDEPRDVEEGRAMVAAAVLGVAGPNETGLNLEEWAANHRAEHNRDLPKESGLRNATESNDQKHSSHHDGVQIAQASDIAVQVEIEAAAAAVLEALEPSNPSQLARASALPLKNYQQACHQRTVWLQDTTLPVQQRLWASSNQERLDCLKAHKLCFAKPSSTSALL
jgi:hypothetical protein